MLLKTSNKIKSKAKLSRNLERFSPINASNITCSIDSISWMRGSTLRSNRVQYWISASSITKEKHIFEVIGNWLPIIFSLSFIYENLDALELLVQITN